MFTVGDKIKIRKDYPNRKLIKDDIKHRNNDDVGVVMEIRNGNHYPITVKFENNDEILYFNEDALVKINDNN